MKRQSRANDADRKFPPSARTEEFSFNPELVEATDVSSNSGGKGCHDCLWYYDTAHVAAKARPSQVMPKRGSDADGRVFFDQLLSLGVSRLRATGAIRLEDRHGVIAFGDKQKLVGLAHTTFPNGGSWSYFVCQCGRRAKRLWLVDDAPRCRLCLEKLGVRYRAAYGFGRTERLRERDRRVDRLQAMLEGGPMRFKPVPPNWGNRRLDRRNRLTAALQRARIATRLAQIAYQAQQSSEPHEPLPLLRAYKPRADAIEAIPKGRDSDPSAIAIQWQECAKSGHSRVALSDPAIDPSGPSLGPAFLPIALD